MAEINKQTRFSKSFERLKRYVRGNTIIVPDGDRRLRLKTLPLTANYQDPLWNFSRNTVYNSRLFNQYYNNPESQRLFLFVDYNMMERDPIIARALSLISEETCLPDENEQIIHIHTTDERIKLTLQHLFYEIMKVDYSLQSWVRQMLKYGDCFVYLNLKETLGIVDTVVLPSSDVERIEENDKTLFKANGIFQDDIPEERMLHFRNIGNSDFLPYGMCLKYNTRIETEDGYKEIQHINIGDVVCNFDIQTQTKVKSKVLDVVCSGKKEILKISTKNNFLETSKEHKIMFFNKETNEFDYKNAFEFSVGDLLVVDDKDDSFKLERVKSIEALGEELVYDINVENDNHNFYANGIVVHNSHLEPIRRIWRMTTLMEDFMMTYYLLRSVNQRVFKVDVGNLAPKDIPSFINKLRDMYRREPIINKDTGEYNLYYDPMTLIEDFIVPVRDGIDNTSIDELPASPETSLQEGLNYLRQKMMAGLGVPNFLLNYEEQLNARATASAEDIRLAKLVESIQRIIVAELEKSALIHLALQGYPKESLFNFSLSLTSPSNLHEMEKLELMNTRLETAVSALESKFYSKKWIWRHILNLSENEIEEMEAELLQDALDEKMTEDQISNFEFASDDSGSDMDSPTNDTEQEMDSLLGGDEPTSGEGSRGGLTEPQSGKDEVQSSAPSMTAQEIAGGDTSITNPSDERREVKTSDRKPRD